MSKVVFILGAGCSKTCGAPLMSEFLDVASSLYSVGKIDPKDKTFFEEVFKAIGELQIVHSKSQLDLNNIESVFNAFEIANTLKKLPGYEPTKIPEVIRSLRRLIVCTLEATVKFPFSRGLKIPIPYDSFIQLIQYISTEALPKKSVSVITFNYDIALDYAFYASGIKMDYCLGEDNLSNVSLLKLHGSLNWGLKYDGTVIPLTLNKYFAKYHVNDTGEITYVSVPIGTQIKEYFSKFEATEVLPDPVIVPPSWNKAEYHVALTNVWAKAAKELEEAEYIYIIGYSLPETDAFFKLLYALGTIGKIPLKAIHVYNPDKSGQTRKRFESIMGLGALARFEYKESSFVESITFIRNSFPST
jgi:hypothetical protein